MAAVKTEKGIVYETVGIATDDFAETLRRMDYQVAFSAHELSLMKESQPPSIPPGVTVPLPVELAPPANMWLLLKSAIEPS